MRFAAAALFLLLSSLAGAAQSVIVPLADVDRRAVAPLFLTGEDSRFYAFDYCAMMRLDRDGATLDIDPIQLTDGSIRDVAAGAGVIVVSLSESSDARTLVGLDRNGFAIWKRPHVPAGPMLFDGRAFVILSTTWGVGLTLTRFDPAGNQLAAHAIPDSAHPWRPAMARAGDDVVVAWYDRRQLIARFVDAEGRTSEPRVLSTNETSDYMAIASSGTDAVITWSYGERVRAVRFDRERLLGGPATLARERSVESPLIAWDGRVYRVAWRTTTPGRVNAVDLRDGLDFDSVAHFDFPVHTDYRPLLLAVAGDRFLLTFGGRSVVRGAGEPIRGDLSPHPVFTGHTRDDRPSVAWAGDRYVAAWFRITPQYEYEIHARFFSIDGRPLGPSFLVTDDAGSGRIAIAATRDTVLVAWDVNDYPRERPGMRRFDLDGHMIDAAPILLTRASTLDVATDGTEFMLASTYECDVFVRRVAARDPFTDENLAPAGQCTEGRYGYTLAWLPRLAWDGEEYGLLFYSDTIEFDAALDVYTPALIRVSRNGSATAPISLGEYGQGRWPTLAAAAGHYFTTANRTGPRLVPFDLSTIRQMEDADAYSSEYVHDLVWTGNAYLAVYGSELRFYGPSGHRLATSQYLPQGFSMRAAAGNDCGGAMIAYVGGKADAQRLEGAFLPCDPGRRRSVR